MTTTVKPARVIATPAALDLIARLRGEHGDVLFHQSGGCCDGSAPMCYPQGEFLVGDGDVLLGEIGGAPFYIGAAQFDYWKHTQLVIDVVPGQGGMFSLDNGTGLRFLTRSRLFSDDELAHLTAGAAAANSPSLSACTRGARPLREFWRPSGGQMRRSSGAQPRPRPAGEFKVDTAPPGPHMPLQRPLHRGRRLFARRWGNVPSGKGGGL